MLHPARRATEISSAADRIDGLLYYLSNTVGRAAPSSGFEGKAARAPAERHAAAMLDLLARKTPQDRKIDLADRRVSDGEVVEHAIVRLDLGAIFALDRMRLVAKVAHQARDVG